MDGGPFRVPRPTDRGAVNRSEPAHRQPAVSHSVEDDSRVTHRGTSPHHAAPQKKSHKRLIWSIVAGAIVLILAAAIAGWFLLSQGQKTDEVIDKTKHQAVFFTNGQVYFGKLQMYNDEYLKMTDIFYLQTQSGEEETESKNPQQASTDKNNSVQLIKLGSEVHGPEDQMMISKDQVLFFENIKSDGKVAKSIQQYKAAN